MTPVELKKYNRIIIGVDPGTNVMGYGIIGECRGSVSLIHMSSLSLKKITDTYLKLDSIYRKIQELVEQYLPDEMAIEAPFYGKNVQSMLKLGRAQGVAIAAALSRQVPISEYEPRKVKLAITGSGAASKEQVQEMVRRLLNLKQNELPAELDASDAVAIALCHYYESKKVAPGAEFKNWKDFIARNPDRLKGKR